MSKIKHLIHKVASATGGKRNSLKSTVSNEAAPEVAAHRNVVGFAKTNREVHPPPQGGTNHHGRRRNRSLSLTEEKALRCEAREAAEEREKQRHDAEKQKAYDEVRSSPHVLQSSYQDLLHLGPSERQLRRQAVYEPEVRCDSPSILMGRTQVRIIADHMRRTQVGADQQPFS